MTASMVPPLSAAPRAAKKRRAERAGHIRRLIGHAC